MKKLLITIMLLGFVSCAPIANNHPIMTPSVTVAKENSTATPTSLRLKQTVSGIVQRDYDPTEWELIYDKDMVWQSDISPTQQIWVTLGRGEIAFFEDDHWVLFSGQDYGFADKPNDMAIAPDGTVWVSGRQAISRYQNGQWEVFPIPNMSKTAITRLAIDPSGAVWITTPSCYCEKSIKRFDGTRWEEFSVTDKHLEAWQLLFTPNETLWASFNFPGRVGEYDGKTWKIYSGTDLWPEGPLYGIEIASDIRGNIYCIYERQEWIVRINRDGSISKIPFDPSSLSLNESIITLFIDRQDTIWIHACLNNQKNACLAANKNGQWVSFVNLPFYTVTNLNELADGTLLVATEKGLYQFNSGE